jgi:hypothetical protein
MTATSFSSLWHTAMGATAARLRPSCPRVSSRHGPADVTVSGSSSHGDGHRQGIVAAIASVAILAAQGASAASPAAPSAGTFEEFVGDGRASSSAAPLRHLGQLAGENYCDGYDEEWTTCIGLPPCSACRPEDCKFHEWGEWYSGGGCTGLIFRERAIQVANNDCGRPCTGDKTESKVSVPKECEIIVDDCVLEGWTEWTKCVSETDQLYRTRGVWRPPLNGGQPCADSVKETKPCSNAFPPVDCTLSEWQAWTDCSATCGPGFHRRMRRILEDAQHGGKACADAVREVGACTMHDCFFRDCLLSAWSDWSVCNAGQHPQRYRRRVIENEAESEGLPCDGPLKEMSACKAPEPSDCVLSEWSVWGNCDKSCGGGQMFRARVLEHPSKNGGKCALHNLRSTTMCNMQTCIDTSTVDCKISEWASWGDCSTTCGTGSVLRIRRILKDRKVGGRGCVGPLQEIGACDLRDCSSRDCAWSDWYDWSVCSLTCGGGNKRRSRVVEAAPRIYGVLCEPLLKSEVTGCGEEPCMTICNDGKWAPWHEWSICSVSCAGGYRKRYRNIAKEPDECGQPVTGVHEEYSVCLGLPSCEKDQDCQLSD